MAAPVLSHTLYIQVFDNKLVIRHLGKNIEVSSTAELPFSSTRLLVGDFTAAAAHFKKSIAQCIAKASRFNFGFNAVVHPRDKIDGGLSQVEERTLMVLMNMSGARKIHIHLGHVLSDAEVVEKLNA